MLWPRASFSTDKDGQKELGNSINVSAKRPSKRIMGQAVSQLGWHILVEDVGCRLEWEQPEIVEKIRI